MTFLWIAKLSATHIRPNKIFSGLIQPFPHAFPIDEGNKASKTANFAKFARKHGNFLNRKSYIVNNQQLMLHDVPLTAYLGCFFLGRMWSFTVQQTGYMNG